MTSHAAVVLVYSVDADFVYVGVVSAAAAVVYTVEVEFLPVVVVVEVVHYGY